MAKTYILKEGSIHDKFFKLRTPFQIMGGGYGNGKTSAAVIKALELAKDYPGSNGLMARSTYPKLNDTLRRTFIDFCPTEWIANFPRSKNSDNTCTLVNGTTINFRYISQRTSTEDGGSTSNLLSATYDWIVVDQLEDPEIVHKDFTDLVGRLRGSTIYKGDDPTMPRTGPRWMMLTTNPTRNWVYSELVEPLKIYEKTGRISDKLLCRRDRDGKVVYGPDGKPIMLMSLVEGSTYENAHVLEADFIENLESVYKGQQRDRFLRGEWAAYEGLVYPDFNTGTHVIRHDALMLYMASQIRIGAKLTWIEGYDFGIQAPSCYLLAFVDLRGNIFVVDGFHKPEAPIEWQAKEIRDIRHRWAAKSKNFIYADPAIFRRHSAGGKLVGKSISDLFFEVDSSLMFARGNNDIMNGITKVSSYLGCQTYHEHPITREPNSPFLYFSDNLTWLHSEMSGYYWKTNSQGVRIDEPTDKNDHSMDALKYMLSYAPEPAHLMRNALAVPGYLHSWTEMDPEQYAV